MRRLTKRRRRSEPVTVAYARPRMDERRIYSHGTTIDESHTICGTHSNAKHSRLNKTLYSERWLDNCRRESYGASAEAFVCSNALRQDFDASENLDCKSCHCQKKAKKQPISAPKSKYRFVPIILTEFDNLHIRGVIIIRFALPQLLERQFAVFIKSRPGGDNLVFFA